VQRLFFLINPEKGHFIKLIAISNLKS
jgi:hypothetical protein